jgi:hypothetical protein
MKIYILIIGLLCIMPLNVEAQQAWTKEKGKYYTQIGTTLSRYDNIIDKEFIPLNRTITDLALSFYGEYGLFKGLTLSTQVPFKYTRVTDGNLSNVENGSKFGLSNVDFILTGSIFNKEGVVVSGKTRFGLPTASFDSKTGIRTGFDATSVEPALLVGVGAAKFFTSAEYGIEIRNNNYPNRQHFGFQLGTFLFNRKMLAIAVVEGYLPLEESRYDDGNGRFTALYLSTQSWVSPTIKLGYYVTPKNIIWFSVGGGLAGTKDIGASPGITLSFSKSN